jgi:peroxiredoxin
MPGYAAFHRQHQGSDARVLGISMDGASKKAEATGFLTRHELPFPNLIAEPFELMSYYLELTGAPFRGTPTLLIYGPDGELRAAQAGAVPVESIEGYIARKTNEAKS